MSETVSPNVVVVDTDPDERMEVKCEPFEPQFANYQGEMLLSIHYRGKEESFAVLNRDQAARLAVLLAGDDR